MNVVLLNGSPHPHGCTNTALCEVAKALEQNGIKTQILQLGAQPFRGCIGCKQCAATHKCVFGNDDGINNIIEAIQAADGFIVGAAVHYASANGSIISALDRIFYAAGSTFAHKPAAAVTSARRAGTTATLDELTKYFTISQMPVVSSCYWNMVHGNSPGDVQKDEEGLQIMRTLGNNMAWLIQCIAAANASGINPPVAEPKLRTNFIR